MAAESQISCTAVRDDIPVGFHPIWLGTVHINAYTTSTQALSGTFTMKNTTKNKADMNY